MPSEFTRLFVCRTLALLVGAVALHVHAQPLAITGEPADAITNVGGVASFQVTATGAPPLTYAWSRDGAPIPGATEAVLVLDAVAAAEAGLYQARVANAGSSVSSRIARLTVAPPPASPLVDPAFRADPRLNTTPSALLPLANGQLIVAAGWNEHLVRLDADGTLDSAFVPALFEPPFASSEPLRIDQIVAQRDGRLLVVGNFASLANRPAAGVARLNRDGTRDESFSPPPDLPLLNLHTSDTGRRVALQSSGRILVLTSRGLVRLMPDGSLDATFNADVAGTTNAAAFAVDARDRVYVGLGREQAVARLLPDGAEDPAFARRAADVEPSMKLHVLADGRLLVNGVRTVTARPVSRRIHTLARWLEDGTLDASFPVLNEGLFTAPDADGALLMADGTLVSADGARTPLNLGFGQFDSPVMTNRLPATFAPDGRIYLFGGFSFHHGVRSPRVIRLNRVAAAAREVDEHPKILAAWADDSAVTLGERTTLHVAATAPGPVTYEWRSLNIAGDIGTTARTSTPRFEFAPRYMVERGTWTVRVLNSAGEAISERIEVQVRPAALRIASQPSNVTLAPGRRGRVQVEIGPYAEVARAEWLRNGMVVARYPHAYQPNEYPAALSNGVTSLWLELGPVTPALEGTYTLVLSSPGGAVLTSAPITVRVADVPRLVNMSTRGFVGEADRAVVLGFVLPAGAPRTIAVRGIGPALRPFGVASALADARLELFNEEGRRVAANDRWREYGATPAGAFALPADSEDAMIIAGISPGAYTVRLSGPPGVTGIGLVELYENDDVSDRLLNISTRVYVVPAEPAAIAGFVIRGAGAKRVLLRAAGPALAPFGVANPLANPRLEVRDAAGTVVASNDDWWRQTDATAVADAAARAGAFPFTAGSADAALVLSLAAGSYTAVLTSVANDPGAALLELYELP